MISGDLPRRPTTPGTLATGRKFSSGMMLLGSSADLSDWEWSVTFHFSFR